MSEPYAGWAIVEIMGHQSYAGEVRPEAMYGAEMLRIDVPELPAFTKSEFRYRYSARQEEVEIEYPAVPAFTKFFGGNSIYSLTPCSEDIGRAAATSMRKQPVTVVSLPELDSSPRVVQPLLASALSGEDDQEDENRTDAGERW
jgi:hypothetical protein